MQFPVLLLVGIGACGDQYPAVAKGRREVVYGLYDLGTSAFRLRDFIQTIQEKKSSFLEQSPFRHTF